MLSEICKWYVIEMTGFSLSCSVIILKVRRIIHRTVFVLRFHCNKKGYVRKMPNCRIEGAKRSDTCKWKIIQGGPHNAQPKLPQRRQKREVKELTKIRYQGVRTYQHNITDSLDCSTKPVCVLCGSVRMQRMKNATGFYS